VEFAVTSQTPRKRCPSLRRRLAQEPIRWREGAQEVLSSAQEVLRP
jgi:hypothetical protein